MKLLEIISVGFDVTDQLLIRSFAFVRYWRKNGSTMRVHQLFVDFKKAHDSVRREVLYNIVIEFEVHMTLVGLTNICLNKICSKVRIRKYLSDKFPIQNWLKQGDALSPLLFNFALEYKVRKFQGSQVRLKLNGTHQLLVCADDANLLGDNIDNIKKNKRNFNKRQ
jgi:hypothetical protein